MTDLTTALARLKELGVEVPETEEYMVAAGHDMGFVAADKSMTMAGDAAILELCAVVERQQRMLRLAYFEGVHIHRAGQTLADATRLWLADLAARAEEDS
jgi:hypothetical protein